MALVNRAAKPAADIPEEAKKAAQVAATAPDSKAATKTIGNRKMFNLGFEEEFLDQVDAYAKRFGLKRPALIRVALVRLMESGGL